MRLWEITRNLKESVSDLDVNLIIRELDGDRAAMCVTLNSQATMQHFVILEFITERGVGKNHSSA